MRNSWARAFLERFDEFLGEDTTMTDPMFYPNAWKKARDLAARDAAIGALSEAARKERDRRALANQFYERQALWEKGICPDCLYEIVACQCENPDDGRYCDECNKPIEACDCLPFADAREVQE